MSDVRTSSGIINHVAGSREGPREENHLLLIPKMLKRHWSKFSVHSGEEKNGG